MSSLKPTGRCIEPGCLAELCLVGFVVRRRGDLDLPGWRKDLGSASLVFVGGQDRVDVVAELESNCLWGLAAVGVVSLNLHGERDGFHLVQVLPLIRQVEEGRVAGLAE